MGTYPPRACGIATFNQDLLQSSQKYFGSNLDCKVAAMNVFPMDTYLYPHEVSWKLAQNNPKDYHDLAIELNSSPLIQGVVIQHEYGIFGGPNGAHLLKFSDNCQKPIMITMHTVLPKPDPQMYSVTKRLIDRANIVVVLTQSSKVILEQLYPKSLGKLHVIPHGIHATPFTSTQAAKRQLKLSEHKILSTFGLLSRGKGLEYVIKALPELIKKNPTLLYLILGETHPVVRREEGESYRNELAQLISRLHLEDHVRFYDQYLSLPELLQFLKATDIYLSTSINPNQAVSGTLSYALGTGRAVVSTSFTQAKELITPQVGRLVPVKQSQAFSIALNDLLSQPDRLLSLHRHAYKLTRPMLWGRIARQYSILLHQFILPPINLDHLANMTDKFGLFQFAEYEKPNKKFGYTLDDNARALVICSWLNRFPDPRVAGLTRVYLKFIEKCQLPNGQFTNYLDFPLHQSTAQNNKEDLSDPTARAIWALCEVISNNQSSSSNKALANKLFLKSIPHNLGDITHLRYCALMIKSLVLAYHIQSSFKNSHLKMIKDLSDHLVKELTKNSIKSWQWFESALGYNNAIIPESLLIAGRLTRNPIYTQKGITTLNFLIQKTFSANRYLPIGQDRWYQNLKKRSHFDQQPEDPASMILALTTAYQITGDKTYAHLTKICFSWFLGNNSNASPLYNPATGGCYDGLHPDRVNLNQGAESMVSYLLSRLSISRH